MGFTRYWSTREGKIKKETIEKINLAVEIAKNDFGIVTEHSINEEKIKINGDKSQKLDYETFLITEKKENNFCKTNEMPYDVVVNAVLKLLEIDGKVYDIESDGGNEEEVADRLFLRVNTEYEKLNTK